MNNDNLDFKCIFCDIDPKRIIMENHFCVGIYDDFPVTDGHMLIIPKRHIENYFDLTTQEKVAMDKMTIEAKNHLENTFKNIDGFNLGVNIGFAAGQSVMHCHIHIIPRRLGDCNKPKGGVRGVIPDKQNYEIK